MIIYLSGPISGLPDLNRPAFDRAEIIVPNLIPGGVEIYSPPRFCTDLPEDWQIRMKRCVRYLVEANLVVVLPRWWASKGAIIEVKLAQQMGIKVQRLVSVLEDDADENGPPLDSYRLFDLAEPTVEELATVPLDLWWQAMSDRMLKLTVPKATEYGTQGADLVSIGKQMSEIGHMIKPADVEERQWWAELGCHFYLVGKISRAGEAFRNGKLPSMDTYFDTECYAKMQQRIRQSTYWG